MGRLRRRMYEEYRNEFSSDERFNIAYRKVRRIKGFYSHLKVYLIVNAIIIISSLDREFIGSHFNDSGIFEWHTYSTAFYWGIALVMHAVSVFGRDVFFSDDWEERKIQEYMNQESTKANKWQ